MPVIKSRVPDTALLALFEPRAVEILHAYAAFVGESVTYVLTQLVDTVLAADPEFVAWRETHAGTFVPPTATRQQSRTAGKRGRPRIHTTSDKYATTTA